MRMDHSEIYWLVAMLMVFALAILYLYVQVFALRNTLDHPETPHRIDLSEAQYHVEPKYRPSQELEIDVSNCLKKIALLESQLKYALDEVKTLREAQNIHAKSLTKLKERAKPTPVIEAVALPPPPPQSEPISLLSALSNSEWEEGHRALLSLRKPATNSLAKAGQSVYRTLSLHWEATYAGTSPLEWTPQELTDIDYALYHPLKSDELTTLPQSAETLLRKLKQLQNQRIQELKKRGVERIEGVQGVTTIQANILEVDSEQSMIAPETPEQAQTYHSILPGKGGYRHHGAVLKKTFAVFYNRYGV